MEKIKIDFRKFKNSFKHEFTSTNNVKKKCICIPIEDNFIFEGDKGDYFTAVMFKSKEVKWGQTHSIKVDLPQDKRGQSKEYPFIGNVVDTDLEYQERNKVAPKVEQQAAQAAQEVVQDLPF